MVSPLSCKDDCWYYCLTVAPRRLFQLVLERETCYSHRKSLFQHLYFSRRGLVLALAPLRAYPGADAANDDVV